MTKTRYLEFESFCGFGWIVNGEDAFHAFDSNRFFNPDSKGEYYGFFEWIDREFEEYSCYDLNELSDTPKFFIGVPVSFSGKTGEEICEMISSHSAYNEKKLGILYQKIMGVEPSTPPTFICTERIM